MDRRRLILLVAMILLVPLIFFQLKKLGTPKPVAAPVQVQQPVVETVTTKWVLVAKDDIKFGTRLTPESFDWKEWPEELLSPEYTIRANNQQAMENLAGGVARSEIYANEPITERKIVMPGTKGVMAALLRPGMRAVTTRISVDTAAGGFIQPGDHVDIILTSAITGLGATGGGGKRFSAETIFENVRVLAIDQTFSTDSGTGASVIGSTATFEMNQFDAEMLQQSVAQGDLSLTLRPMGRASAPGKSQASVKRKGGATSMTIYRNGQPTQVAIRGQ